MIIEDQQVEIRISGSNKKHYIEAGYCDLNLGDILTIPVSSLSYGSRVKVDVRCDYCGKIVKVAYKDYLKYKYDKYSCAHCRQRKTSEYNLDQRRDSLYKRAMLVCNEKGYDLLTPIDQINNADARIQYNCPKHGVHETKIFTLICGHGCLDCAYEENGMNSRKTSEDVYNEFLQLGGVLLNKEEYCGWSYKNLKVICAECKEIFITSYCAFTKLLGQVCPRCANKASKGERKIRECLENQNIKFETEYRFYDCRSTAPLPFDFYLPQHNICIEYDGEGHYIPIKRGLMTDEDATQALIRIKERDMIKTEFCESSGIKLIRIPYWEFDNIPRIIDNILLT